MNADKVNKELLEIEQNLFSKFCYLPQKLGWSITKKNHSTIIDSGTDSSMFNVVFDSKLPEERIVDTIKSTIADFKEKPFVWCLGPSHVPKSLGESLKKLGFKQEPIEQAMICELREFSPSQKKSELIIKEVKAPDEFLAFTNVIKQYDEQVSMICEKLAKLPLTNHEPFQLFVGYINQQPVAVGALFFTNEIAGIYDIFTIEKYRGQGIEIEMVEFLIQSAKTSRVQFAAFISPNIAGKNNYEKLGFKLLGTFECFEWRKEKS